MFIITGAGIECVARGLKQGKIAFRDRVDFLEKDHYIYYDEQREAAYSNTTIKDVDCKDYYTFTQDDVFATNWVVADQSLLAHKEKLSE